MPKKKEEIFENPSDDELPTAEVEVKDEPSKLPAKKPRKKRVMTEAQRAKAIENLKRGRAKALENRQRKKKLKEIEKEEKRKEEDRKIEEFNQKSKTKSKPKPKTKPKEPEPVEDLAGNNPPSPEPVKEDIAGNKQPSKPVGRSSEDYEKELKSLRSQLQEKSIKKLSPIKEEPEPSGGAPAPPKVVERKKRRACGVRGLSTLRHLNQYR